MDVVYTDIVIADTVGRLAVETAKPSFLSLMVVFDEIAVRDAEGCLEITIINGVHTYMFATRRCICKETVCHAGARVLIMECQVKPVVFHTCLHGLE